jgi:hypothetical protein
LNLTQACFISSKVGLIASIFSKVCSSLWAKWTYCMYFTNKDIAEALIVKIEYCPQLMVV